jgi:thymidylate synthase (FAD)
MVRKPETAQDAAGTDPKPSETFRPTVPGLEALLFKPIRLLDHGFIRVIDYMGDDAAVVQAARVSYGRGTKQLSEDRGLIRYLMRHGHTTPFEMVEIKLHIKLPIFVARQWVRHRTASINEYSARYSILDHEFYMPETNRLESQSSTNRQGSGGILEGAEAEQVLHLLKEDAERNYQHYIWMLNDRSSTNTRDPSRRGLARELARMNLTLSTYTQWYWKINLHNLLRFLRLRADPHAQYEIRVYAKAIIELLKVWVPLTFEAYEEYVSDAVNLSRSAVAVIRRRLAGQEITQPESGLSLREWNELAEIFDLQREGGRAV